MRTPLYSYAQLHATLANNAKKEWDKPMESHNKLHSGLGIFIQMFMFLIVQIKIPFYASDFSLKGNLLEQHDVNQRKARWHRKRGESNLPRLPGKIEVTTA